MTKDWLPVAWQYRFPGDGAEELVPRQEEGTCTGTQGDTRQMAGPPPNDATLLFKHSGETDGEKKRTPQVPKGHYHQEHRAKS